MAGTALSFDDLPDTRSNAVLSFDDLPSAPPRPSDAARRRATLGGMGELPGDAPNQDDEIEAFNTGTTRLDRITNPLRAGAIQVEQGAAGQTADLAARNLRDLEAMRRGDVGGAMAARVRTLSPEDYEAARQARVQPFGQAVSDIARTQAEIEAIPQNPAARDLLKSKTMEEALTNFYRDPWGSVQSIGLQSLPGSAPSMVAGAAGTMAGGPALGAGLMALGSSGTEYIGAVLDGLSDLGVNTRDRQALEAAFNDPDTMQKIRERAALRGGIVGAFDAATFGLASKTLAPKAITSPVARQAVNVPAQMGAQAVGGAGGEAAAQLATEGEIKNPGAVVAEGIGEMITAPGDVGAMALSGARSTGRRLSFDDLPSASTAPRAAPETTAAASPRSPGFSDMAVTPRGRKVGVNYEIREASDLIASNNPDLTANPAYPAELQPRDRTRAASGEQIANIASNLEPALLGRSPSASEGAPIIGPDGSIESGNARVLAIRRAYDQGLPGSQAYREFLANQGFDVSGFRQPVLVRRRTTDLTPADRQAFVREANERATAAMSASELAMSDAKAIPDNLMDSFLGGEIGGAANRDFVRGYLDSVVPTSERGALYTREAGLSQEGVRRIENALFARAYEDADLLASLREDPDSGFKAIGNAMTDAAGLWARMRADAKRGAIPASLDPTAALKEAVDLVRRARRGKNTLADIVNQRDLVSGSASPDAVGFLRLMFKDDKFTRPVSRDRLAGSLRYIAEQASRAQAGKGLFPDQPAVSVADLLRFARQRSDGGLFDVLPSAAEGRTIDFDDLPESAESRKAGTNRAAAGANYTGFVVDKLTGTASETPIRREDILRPLITALNAPIYEGRIDKKSNTLGFFKSKIEEIRLKKKSDIETAAHEIAHLLDGRFPEIRKQWTPATSANQKVRDELRGVSYDASKLYEGFAEFIRLWMTQPAQAQAKAPTFNAWWETFVDTLPQGKAIRKAKADMQAWYDQDAVTRARSKIGVAESINAGLTSIKDRFRQAVFDDLHGIYRMERELTGATAPTGAYVTSRLTRGKLGILEGALLYGVPKVQKDGSTRFEGESLKAILDPVAEQIDGFLMYAVGRSANELMGQGREHLFTRAEIKGMMGLETPEFRTAFEKYQKWNNGILDFAQAKGIISGAQRATWKRTQYVPFHRVGHPGAFQAVPGDWKGIRALTGGDENIRPVLDNIIGNARMLIEGAANNEARQAVAKLTGISGPRGSGKFLVRIPTESEWVKVHRAEVERQLLRALGVSHRNQLPVDMQLMLDQIIDGMETFVPFEIRGAAPGGHNVVAVLEHGKPVYYEVADPLLFRALTRLSRPIQQGLVKWLNAIRGVGQTTITLTPEFMLRNLARDTLMAGILTRHGFRPIIDSARGMKSRLSKDQNYQDFLANGGGISSHVVDEESYRKRLERFYGSKGINYKTVLDSPAKMYDALQMVAETFEMGTRLGEYRRSLERGEHPKQAAYSAREVSTDFAMRGDNAVVGFLYDSIIFLKAAMNGLDRLYRGLAHDENRFAIAVKVGLLALTSMALYAINRGNPLYDDLEDFDKDGHWHFFIPTVEAMRAGGDVPLEKRYHHIRLPKTWETGAIGSIAERSMGRLMDGEPKEYVKDVGRIIRNVFSVDYLPHAVAPLYEQAINRNRFTDTPIETESMKEVEPWARSSPFGSQALRKLGEMTRNFPKPLQVNPARTEALLRGYFNSYAAYGLGLADAALVDGKADARIEDYPVIGKVIGSFYRNEPARSTRHIPELYEAIEAATQTRRTMRLMDRTYRPEIAGDLENRTDNALYSQLQKADQNMRALNREMGFVHQARTLPQLRDMAEQRNSIEGYGDTVARAKSSGAWNSLGGLKRLLLDDLTRERNAYAKTVNLDVKSRRKELEQQQ